ncbi:pilus assembly protein PilP [Roseivivax sediminis]|uniref:Pilus assembly protein, PilP n=1 Tax=Roseivivax sediminis TaxID=936889 RepID=A0A1I1YGL5_9RHOB|nr:pilus assembly protein PilP [Roseivivax sediminis]SFE18707.1 hypothetical protein SAMN04515678_10743 [Roseivivax sediminis]
MAQQQTPDQVARTATTEAPLNLREITLLGTSGTQDAPTALVRLPSGKVARVARGSRIGRSEVAAIEETRLALVRGGRARWIEIPGS